MLGAVLLICVVGADVSAAEQHGGHPLGTVNFPISCSTQAQSEFNRAVALLHHMTYPQASEAFQKVAVTDPRCAMAHWGIAMTLFQPLWPTRPGKAALERGWQETQQAKAIQPQTPREKLFVAAAEAFFLEPAGTDYWLRIRRWEEASEKLHTAFPSDPEVETFYALSLLATAPAKNVSREHADRAAGLLLDVYHRHPDHPGAMHYLVHANDMPGREKESLEITRKYEAAAPDNPHALHMPTHIYTRLGEWDGVIRGNLKAAQAALKYPAGEHGEFVWDEFPHAIEYLVYAYLQRGADDQAAAQLKRLQTTARIEPSPKTAFHMASAPSRYALERRDWTAASQLVPREPANLDWNRFPWPEAIVRFSRGLGAAHLGNRDEAKASIARIGELEAATTRAGEDLFARNVRVLRIELSAWLAHVEGQKEGSVALMREAAELEAATPKPPVTPAPTLPAYELLGDLLMEQQKPAGALAAYQKATELYPNRFNSLLGAARAAQALEDESLALATYRKLLEIAVGGTRQPALDEARKAVDGVGADPAS